MKTKLLRTIVFASMLLAVVLSGCSPAAMIQGLAVAPAPTQAPAAPAAPAAEVAPTIASTQADLPKGGGNALDGKDPAAGGVNPNEIDPATQSGGGVVPQAGGGSPQEGGAAPVHAPAAALKPIAVKGDGSDTCTVGLVPSDNSQGTATVGFLWMKLTLNGQDAGIIPVQGGKIPLKKGETPKPQRTVIPVTMKTGILIDVTDGDFFNAVCNIGALPAPASEPVKPGEGCKAHAYPTADTKMAMVILMDNTDQGFIARGNVTLDGTGKYVPAPQYNRGFEVTFPSGTFTEKPICTEVQPKQGVDDPNIPNK